MRNVLYRESPEAQEYQIIESSTILQQGDNIEFEVRGVSLSDISPGTTPVSPSAVKASVLYLGLKIRTRAQSKQTL